MGVNAKIYKEQGGEALAICAGDGAVVKGQASAEGTPAQAAHIANPTGGTTTDAEARTAINAILVALENVGILAAS